jgi:hypothetical protein
MPFAFFEPIQNNYKNYFKVENFVIFNKKRGVGAKARYPLFFNSLCLYITVQY